MKKKMKRQKMKGNEKSKKAPQDKLSIVIQTVTYSRLINTGNYENSRIEASASVTGDPDVAFDQLVEWVDKKCDKVEGQSLDDE